KAIERFKARFIADTIHDLSTPISALSTRLYLLKRSPERLDEHVSALENQVRHLQALLSDLRALSALDRGRPALHRERCNVNQLARQVCDTYMPVALDKGQSLNLITDPALPDAQLDSGQMERVMVNLVANAINYSPGGTTIHVRTALEADHIIFSV